MDTRQNHQYNKVKATKDETPPNWSFDGSSTQQAEGEVQTAYLPVQTYENPNGHDLVMTQVQSQIIPLIHLSQAAAAEVVTDEWWFDLNRNTFSLTPKLVNR